MKTQFETLSEIAINNGFYAKSNDLRHETFICDGGRYDNFNAWENGNGQDPRSFSCNEIDSSFTITDPKNQTPL